MLTAATDELMGELTVLHAWDIPGLSLGLALAVGGGDSRQRFETTGLALTCWGSWPFAGAMGNATFDFGAGFLLSADASAEVHVLRLQGRPRAGVVPSTHLAFRFGVSVGRWF